MAGLIADRFRSTLETARVRHQCPPIPSTRSTDIAPALLGTALALLAFAANSILCRLALGGARIDAASFTLIRLVAGAVSLLMICLIRKNAGRGVWRLDAVSRIANSPLARERYWRLAPSR
jgi:hypothetical protein